MEEDNINWSRRAGSAEPKKGPHRDYDSNLAQAETFSKNVQKSLLNGMNVKVVDGEGIPKAMLMISWKPPMNSRIGNYATPIFLHQNRSEVSKQIEAVFNCYMSKVKDFNASSQLSLIEPGVKV